MRRPVDQPTSSGEMSSLDGGRILPLTLAASPPASKVLGAKPSKTQAE